MDCDKLGLGLHKVSAATAPTPHSGKITPPSRCLCNRHRVQDDMVLDNGVGHIVVSCCTSGRSDEGMGLGFW